VRLPDRVRGNVRKQDFRGIWENAEVFRVLRDEDNCRASAAAASTASVHGLPCEAYACTGNYLAPEPYCVYEPKGAHR